MLCSPNYSAARVNSEGFGRAQATARRGETARRLGVAGSWPRVYDEVRKPDRHPDPDKAMVQASVSESGVASVSASRLKTYSRDVAALKWRESESRIGTAGPLNNRPHA